MSRSTGSQLPGALTTGICSVTLRSHSIDGVVAIAVRSGLDGIEWGADVHVRDARTAEQAREATAAAGLAVLSLGSYYRVGCFGDFDAVTRLANALGAPRIRVWAGERASADADRADWAAVIGDARRISGLAASHGLEVAFEFHGGTLTDSDETTLELLDAVDMANVRTYWQPAVGLSDRDAIASLHRVVSRVSAVHCFSWWPLHERLPLAGRRQLWQDVAGILRDRGEPVDIMLEFVADDLPDNVVRDSAFLNGVAAGGR
jgi:3-dehydroshikimate dehydratase